MFSWFERLVSPFPDTPPEQPPEGFFPFIWSASKGLRGLIAAMALLDAVARLQPGVLHDAGSHAQDSFNPALDGLLDCPHYTRPERDGAEAVPAVLLSGDHAAIRRWRLKQSLGRTWLRRPDLLARLQLDKERRALLDEFITEWRQQKL